MTVKDDGMMVKIMKPLVVVLLSSLLSLLSILYWDLKTDIEEMNDRNHMIDSLRTEERAERALARFSDSLQTAQIIKILNEKVEDTGI